MKNARKIHLRDAYVEHIIVEWEGVQIEFRQATPKERFIIYLDWWNLARLGLHLRDALKGLRSLTTDRIAAISKFIKESPPQ